MNRLTLGLVRAWGDQAIVAVQNPIRLDRCNETEPDFAILRPRADFYDSGEHAGPNDVLLLVEVADSSLRFDRHIKLPLYTRFGIPEVWIVNLVQRRVEAFRDPSEDRHGSAATHSFEDTLALASAPEIVVLLGPAFG